MAGKRTIVVLAVAGVFVRTVAAVNKPIPQPKCNASQPVKVRYAESTARLYIEAGVEGERGGCVTLGQIFKAREGKPPLYAMDPVSGNRSTNATGTWLLTEELYIEDGITLNVHGGADGDADELRILSVNGTVLNVRAYGASLSFHNTKVISWDDEMRTVDTNVTDGRSYISAVSEVVTDDLNYTCVGAAKKNMGEARMDIVNSEIAYLGFYDSESYGLTWKVRGFCEDKSNQELFGSVNVYGNIYDSKIHHNYFGVYTYGHQQGDWRRNQMYSNIQYGFDPHDDSDQLNIHDNEVWGNGNHGIIASKRCNNVSIQDNRVWNGMKAGLFLHRSSDYAIVKGNYVYSNGDAGLALLEAYNAEVSDNIFQNNKYGIRFSVGSKDNRFSGNFISNSTKYGAYSYQGTDAPYVSESGRSQNNVFFNNTISGGGEAVKMKESDGTAFVENIFVDAAAIRFDNATEVLMQGNTGLNYVELKVLNGACFDVDSDSEFVPKC